MANLKKGIVKIRQSVSRVKKIDPERYETWDDKNIQAVIKAYDGKTMNLLKEIKAIKGRTSEEVVESILGKQTKAKSKTRAKRVSKKADSKPKASKANNVTLITPIEVECPDTDNSGNEVALVIGKDGLFGCGVIIPPN